MLNGNRLFPAESAARSVAVKLYESIHKLPIISPHGHTDPQWFADNKPFPSPAALLLQPDHYIFRMLYSQGVSLESLGVPQVDGKQQADPREAWRIFARHYYLFRGTPTRLWLDYTFQEQFGLKDRLSAENADEYYEHIDKLLQTPEFLPRALFEQFNIEVLATTVPQPTHLSITRRSGPRDGRVACFRRFVQTPWWMPNTSASMTTSSCWAR